MSSLTVQTFSNANLRPKHYTRGYFIIGKTILILCPNSSKPRSRLLCLSLSAIESLSNHDDDGDKTVTNLQ